MKAIPEAPEQSVEPLYEIAHHAVSFCLLRTAIDFHVHDFFEKPRTAQEFSNSIHADSELIEKFLNALVAMGLLIKEDSLYVNSPVASVYLVSQGPFFQGDMLKHMQHGLTTRWANLGRWLKEGPPSPNDKRAHLFNKDFVSAIAQWALAGGVHHAARVMASLPEFTRARRLLDVGGGHGLYTIAFCQANPQLEGVVLDLPPVIESAKEFIAKYEMQDRVRTISGDYANDDWGGMYDIIFASDVFFRAPQLMAPIVRKISNSLNEGGVFVSKHQKMDKTLTSPAQTVFHDLMLFVMRPFTPHTYTSDEFADLFRADGFDVEIFDVDLPCSPSGIMICRKKALS